MVGTGWRVLKTKIHRLQLSRTALPTSLRLRQLEQSKILALQIFVHSKAAPAFQALGAVFAIYRFIDLIVNSRPSTGSNSA
jgi:hypothetical protein